MNTIGCRLKLLRKELDMTQVELATASGVPQGLISSYERGTVKEITATTLLRLVSALNTSPEYLMNGTGDKVLGSSPPDEKKLLEIYRSLPGALKSALIHTASALKETN